MIQLSWSNWVRLTAAAALTTTMVGCAADAGTGGEDDSVEAALLQLPSCVRNLLRSCGTQGQCRVQPGTQRYCYDSGARAEYTLNSLCADGGRREVRVTKPDGSLCFTFEEVSFGFGQLCENGQYTWRDATGTVIATGGFHTGVGPPITIECAIVDDRARCDTGDCVSRLLLFGNEDCKVGDCPR